MSKISSISAPVHGPSKGELLEMLLEDEATLPTLTTDQQVVSEQTATIGKSVRKNLSIDYRDIGERVYIYGLSAEQQYYDAQRIGEQ